MARSRVNEADFLAVNWRRGHCRSSDYDPDLWFDEDRVSVAVTVCKSGAVGLPCPIIEQCLQYALSTHQESGVWGGLSEDQRKIIGWAKSRVRCPGCRSRSVQASHDRRTETCLTCGLSWSV